MDMLVGGLLLFTYLLLCPLPSEAQELEIFTEEDPPYSFTSKDKKPAGYGVEVVREIQKRVMNQSPIEIYPWARAYHVIRTRPGIVVFAMSRTKDREPLFQWVGPIVENDWVLVAKKSLQLKVSSLNDARAFTSIGVVRDYAWDKYLTGQGFTNLERVAEYHTNIKKAVRDRIQAFVSSNLSYEHELKAQSVNVDEFEVVLRFNTVQMYIAHSKDNDRNLVLAWQKAFDDMKQDGTVEKLLKKWLPEAKVPGVAKLAGF